MISTLPRTALHVKRRDARPQVHVREIELDVAHDGENGVVLVDRPRSSALHVAEDRHRSRHPARGPRRAPCARVPVQEGPSSRFVTASASLAVADGKRRQICEQPVELVHGSAPVGRVDALFVFLERQLVFHERRGQPIDGPLAPVAKFDPTRVVSHRRIGRYFREPWKW